MRGPQSQLRKNEDVIFAISEKILSRIKESFSPSKAFYLVSGIWISRHMRKKGQKTMSTKNGSKELHIFLINSYKIVIILKYPFREPEIVQPNSITYVSDSVLRSTRHHKGKYLLDNDRSRNNPQ